MKFNSNAKQIIRSEWAKPILEFLSKTIDRQLFYLGLPDVEALDIKEWIDYIAEVYAFQCRDYPNSSDDNQSRATILQLENTLRGLERKQQLSTYDVFDGYIEEVVLRGFDNSPTRKTYIQEDAITIYNLDFCGQVTSPISYIDKEGNEKQAYKFNAVRQLLDFQERIELSNKKFIMFLTLHCSYSGEEFTNFIKNPPNSDIEEYIAQTKGMSKGKKAPYWVKAFVYHNLIQFFTHKNFIPEFLPTIYYKGDNDSPLLFFTIIGTQDQYTGGVSTTHQKLKKLLNQKFVSISDTGTFSNNDEIALENDKDCTLPINSLAYLKNSKTYKKNWK